MPAAAMVWLALLAVINCCIEVLRLVMPSTVLICASCEVICALSIGFSGSWFCICVTSNCRNALWLPMALEELLALAAFCAALVPDWVAGVEETVMMFLCAM